jgi:Uma2 family endonuclease
MAPTIIKCTLSEYQTMVEAGALDHQSIELIHGEIVEMPPEGLDHAQGSTDTADILRAKFGDRAIVRDAKPITLPNQISEPQPDLAIVVPQREVYRQDHHPYPEDIFLLIEYAKTTIVKDTETKRKLYASAEIQEYWVVNLKTKELIVYHDAHDGDYRSTQTLTTGTITPIAFPDIEIRVKALL